MKISKRTLCAIIALMLAFLSFGCYAGISSAKVEDAYMTEVIDSEGKTIRTGSRMVLCSCGKSSTCPFCDGSHRNLPKKD